jgi:3-phosphoshikimate 1-carboxyvinyltransferase
MVNLYWERLIVVPQTNEHSDVTVSPVVSLRGEIELPGDKSIAHRAALFAALAKGESLFENFPVAQDPLTTVECLGQLGVEYEHAGKTLWLEGKGLYHFREAAKPLDAKNSGTTMRLFAGLLSGQSFNSVITGDISLLSRPMRRIIQPLTLMQARISGSRKGTGPLKIQGTKRPLKSIHYELPVASAQVKTAILLAGLYAQGITTVIEVLPTRDHTERMLGLPIKQYGGKQYISVEKSHKIHPVRMTIPGDPSTAAFFIVAALITPESEILVRNVSLNPTRIAFLKILEKMNGEITILNKRNTDGEPSGDIRVRSSRLRGCVIDGIDIPLLIDEIPILAVAGATADGLFNVKSAIELRYKESDRIKTVVTNLKALGCRIAEHTDGFTISGGSLQGGVTVDSFGDHRIAMASVVAGLASHREVTVKNMNASAISYPGFLTTLNNLQKS